MKAAAFACAIVSGLLGCLSPLFAATIHVPFDQPTIQAGIDAAVAGDIVVVADGTYTGPGNKDLDFKGKAITVQSQNGAADCIIDCENDGRGFWFHSGEGADSILSGFTITRGGIQGEDPGEYFIGGAIFCENSSPNITDCRIIGNSADTGGGIYCVTDSSPTITNCLISENTAGIGGGIHSDSASPIIINSVIADNSAEGGGGGLALNNSSATIVNCTISNNTSGYTGGAASFHGGSSTITNSILWANAPDEINASYADLTVAFCDVQGGYPGQGNFHGDPLFIEAGSGDYRLSVRSPCMDAGTANSAPPKDMDGNPRPQNDGYDLGAYEVSGYMEQRPIFDSFSADASEVYVPFQVNFICTAHDPDGTVTSYSIDFGDGSESETNATGEFSHTYVSRGTVYATCTAFDNSGAAVNSVSIKITKYGDIRVPDDFATIQAAIDASFDGETVIVSDGTYTGAGNKNLDFHGKAITVKSQNGPVNCIIDCEGEGRGFYFHSEEGNNSVVSGFTITNGRATSGGGLCCSNSNPTITKCVIRKNSASDWGGGILLWGANASPVISECVITGNSITAGFPGSGGGGIYCSTSSPTIRNCIISRNTAPGVDGGGIKGGISSSMTIMNCTISGNSAGGGGGISCSSSSARIANSILWGNSPENISNGPIVTFSDVEGGYPGEGNLHGDPLFIDSDNDDYRLSVRSPCMDAGTSVSAPSVDIEGNLRPLNGGYDIGAHEVAGFNKVRPIIDTFVADTSAGFIPLQVTFTCNAHDPDGTIASYGIDYGDGSETQMNGEGLFTYIYTTGGLAYVTCTVTDNSGAETNSYSIPIKRYREIHVPIDYPTIQAAIDEASEGDIVTVMDGTYRGLGNKNIDFKGKAITVASLNGPQSCIVDCENDGQGFNFHAGEGPDSILRGFTITGGRGGGILCGPSSPTIANCIIANNTTLYTHGTYSGGGIICASGDYTTTYSPTFINCIISHNVAGASGGGVYCGGASSPKFINCTITANSCNENYEISGGGGIFADNPSQPTIINSIVWGNSPNEIKAGFGGGFSVTYSNIRGRHGGEGNIALEPAFVDVLSGDYDLKDYSPCIGAGKSVGSPSTDIDGNPRPNPAGSNPDMGAYENSLAVRNEPPLNIFAMDVGNAWSYEGNKQGNFYTVDRRLDLDTDSFLMPTLVMSIKEDGQFVGKEYYEILADRVVLWGASVREDGALYDLKFSIGLPVIWGPIEVGEHQYSTASGTFDQFPGYTFNVSMDVLVIAKETIILGFDSFEAYKLRYQMHVWGYNLDYTRSFTWWVVPYIGVIADEDSESMLKLSSFAIGESIITHQSDADRDGLPDYKELFGNETDWLDSDTDDDGCLDGPEVQGGRNPRFPDPQGDVNGDCALNLADAILALRVLVGIEASQISADEIDVNGDGRVGSEELIWILHRLSGLIWPQEVH